MEMLQVHGKAYLMLFRTTNITLPFSTPTQTCRFNLQLAASSLQLIASCRYPYFFTTTGFKNA
ncbi:hypothetical protein SAMN05444008_102189 [Cnuella takakiae]|uniref:Uncharacterized protein n=1 Tax=Cnuella takakiae TaxID=1302690 RepID=A0A1M4V9N3_9BACT|nr:hypothetical protein SAMN05444008_102189 [Cnuella takakiae]